MSTVSYPSFSSIERLENIYCVISEKIDGTNGLIQIDYKYDWNGQRYDDHLVQFGSRNRYITTTDDNAGFANYFTPHIASICTLAESLINYGDNDNPKQDWPIYIYGEWFGKGIQRGYGLDEKYFMPFSSFYAEHMIKAGIPNIMMPNIMYTGKFSLEVVDNCMNRLTSGGFHTLITNYDYPEGVVIYFPKYNFRLKQTFEGSKWERNITKPEHDKKPKFQKEDFGQCHSCGKRLYTIKDSTGIPKCMNIHCKESPNYKE